MYYGYESEPASAIAMGAGAGIWLIIAFVLAIIGGILTYFLFVKPDKKQDNKFLAWLKDFLNFKKMLIEVLLKIFYIIAAIFTTLGSFAFISIPGVGFLVFLIILILGNVLIRILYETSLIKIMIWKNTNEINKKIK